MAILTAGDRVGPFTIEDTLPAGRGGMARVYVANRQEHGRVQRVALKVANIGAPRGRDADAHAQHTEFYSEALNNEVELLKQLKHPGIVRLYPIPWGMRRNPYIARANNVEEMPWFCAMEYLEGGTLESHLKQAGGKLQVHEAVEITHQLAQALDYLHAKRVAHLDIKPENVLFRNRLNGDTTICPEAVLIDFGIARPRDRSGLWGGSLPYMPPERVRVMTGRSAPEMAGENPPVDIYSLGLLLYRMLTGRLPFSGRTRDGITTAILESNPTHITQYNPMVSPALDDLVMRALSKDPRQRPVAPEFASLIDEAIAPPRYFSGNSGRREIISNVRPVDKRSGTRSFLLTIAGFTLAILGFGLWGSGLRPPDIWGRVTETFTPTATVTVSLTPTWTVQVNPTSPTPLPDRTAKVTPTKTPTKIFTATPVKTYTATSTPTPRPKPTGTPTAPSSPQVSTVTPAP